MAHVFVCILRRLALSRFKHTMIKGKVKHSAVQLPRVQYACTTDKDCYPPNLQNTTIPPKYINCDNSSALCQCNDCFIRENDTCALAKCHNWSNVQCVDQRRSQKTAFLLSVFLSSTGAANFYIGQYDLGLWHDNHLSTEFYLSRSLFFRNWAFKLIMPVLVAILCRFVSL